MLTPTVVSYILRSFILGWFVGYLGLFTTIFMGILTYIAFQFRDTVITRVGEGLASLLNCAPEGCFIRNGASYNREDVVQWIYWLGRRIYHGEQWFIHRGVFLTRIYELYVTMDMPKLDIDVVESEPVVPKIRSPPPRPKPSPPTKMRVKS